MKLLDYIIAYKKMKNLVNDVRVYRGGDIFVLTDINNYIISQMGEISKTNKNVPV